MAHSLPCSKANRNVQLKCQGSYPVIKRFYGGYTKALQGQLIVLVTFVNLDTRKYFFGGNFFSSCVKNLATLILFP
jgi:hypothetical protein